MIFEEVDTFISSIAFNIFHCLPDGFDSEILTSGECSAVLLPKWIGHMSLSTK